MRRFSQKGFSLIELIFAIGVFAVLVAGVTFLAVGTYDSYGGTGDKREEERLAREALEALQAIKERDWNLISTYDDGSNVKVNKDSGGVWTLSAGTETRGSFTRAITIAQAQRDSADDIVASGGTDDPSTKKVVITISGTGIVNYAVQAYVTNWESYRMFQTDWGGSSGTAIWTSGTNNYNTSSNMDLPTTSAKLRLKLSD